MLVKASCCQARGPEKRAGDFQTTLRKLRHDAEMLFASWFMSPAVREVYVAGGAGQGVIGCEEALPWHLPIGQAGASAARSPVDIVDPCCLRSKWFGFRVGQLEGPKRGIRTRSSSWPSKR